MNDTHPFAILLKEPEFLLRVQASIYYKGKQIGSFGIVHPEVYIIMYSSAKITNSFYCI